MGLVSMFAPPMTEPATFRKLAYSPSLSSAVTVISPWVPSIVVRTSKSPLIGGRETPRIIWANSLLYAVELTQPAPHTRVASLVQTADLPRPVCQWARIGSLSAPVASGISTLGAFLRLVRTMPRRTGHCSIPLTMSSLSSRTLIGMPASGSWMRLRFTIVASLMKICGSWLGLSSIGPYALPPVNVAMSSMTGGRFLGLWGKTVTVEMLMRLALAAFIRFCCGAVGSPSLMMMMCLWRAVFLSRPRPRVAPLRGWVSVLGEPEVERGVEAGHAAGLQALDRAVDAGAFAFFGQGEAPLGPADAVVAVV